MSGRPGKFLRGDEKADILLFLLLWRASRSKRRFKAEDCRRFCLPAWITEWSAVGKAVTQGLEFGFCFHAIDLASPLSRLQDRAVAKKSVWPAANGERET